MVVASSRPTNVTVDGTLELPFRRLWSVEGMAVGVRFCQLDHAIATSSIARFVRLAGVDDS